MLLGIIPIFSFRFNLICLLLAAWGGYPLGVIGQNGSKQSEKQLSQKIEQAESLLQHSPDSSLELYNSVIHQANLIGNPNLLHRVWMSLAESYHTLGNFPGAFEACQNALSYCSELNPRCPLEAYRMMGILQADNGNPHLAIPYFNQARQLALNQQDTSFAIRTDMQLGVVEVLQGHFGKADSLLRIGLNYARRKQDSAMISVCFNNLGDVALKEQNLLQAELYFESALSFRPKGKKHDATSIYLNLGLMEIERGNYLQAEELGLKGLAEAKRNQNMLKQRNALEVIYKAQEKLRKTDDAFSSFKQMVELERSLFSVEKTVQIAGMENRALLTQKTNEIELRDFMLEERDEEIAGLRIWRWVLGLFILLSLVGLVWLGRRKRSANPVLPVTHSHHLSDLQAYLQEWLAHYFNHVNEQKITQEPHVARKSAIGLILAYHSGAQAKIQPLDIAGLLREVLSLIRPKAQGQFVSIITELDPEIPSQLLIEGNSLSTLFLILLDAGLIRIPSGKLKVNLTVVQQEVSFCDLQLTVTATPNNLSAPNPASRSEKQPLLDNFAAPLAESLGATLQYHVGDADYLQIQFGFRAGSAE